jgi:hypothetical protein
MSKELVTFPRLNGAIKVVEGMPELKDMPPAYGFMAGNDPATAEYVWISIQTPDATYRPFEDPDALRVSDGEVESDRYLYGVGHLSLGEFHRQADFPPPHATPLFASGAEDIQTRCALIPKAEAGLQLAVVGLVHALLSPQAERLSQG